MRCWLFGAGLCLQIGLLLLGAIQELLGVVALTCAELAAHLLVLVDFGDRLVGLIARRPYPERSARKR